MARQRNYEFYTEAIVVTILSLVSASIWIETIKTTILRYFHNDLIILLTTAFTLTLISLFVLHYFFAEDEEEKES